MPALTVLSGLGPKHPACFLATLGGRRLMLDLGLQVGEGPAEPDLSGLAEPVDAVLLSHQHPDHIGALHRLPRIGAPPVYATPPVARAVAEQFGIACVPLPERGTLHLGPVTVTTGRNGHAPGGVWLHLAAEGTRLLYMGDHSAESRLFPLDPPPAAETVIVDASYGVDDTPQEVRAAAVVDAMTAAPTLLPAPAAGRALELLLVAADAGLPVPAVCARVRTAGAALLERPERMRPGVAARLASLLETAPAATAQGTGRCVILGDPLLDTPEAAAVAGPWVEAGRPVLLTGHVPSGTPARTLLDTGRAAWLRWNVHPVLSDLVRLVEAVGARRVMPAFGRLEHGPTWRDAFAGREVLLSPEETPL